LNALTAEEQEAEKREHQAAHKRWVPTESVTMNGWINGLRGGGNNNNDNVTAASRGGRSNSSNRRRSYSAAQQRGSTMDLLQSARDSALYGGGYAVNPAPPQERSWLRTVHSNSHLLKQQQQATTQVRRQNDQLLLLRGGSAGAQGDGVVASATDVSLARVLVSERVSELGGFSASEIASSLEWLRWTGIASELERWLPCRACD
jgi:hypothetical protein